MLGAQQLSATCRCAADVGRDAHHGGLRVWYGLLVLLVVLAAWVAA
jgi:hypothetical protein